jgi:hypothetical protein
VVEGVGGEEDGPERGESERSGERLHASAARRARLCESIQKMSVAAETVPRPTNIKHTAERSETDCTQCGPKGAEAARPEHQTAGNLITPPAPPSLTCSRFRLPRKVMKKLCGESFCLLTKPQPYQRPA